MTRNLEPGLEPQAHVRVRMYRYSGATVQGFCHHSPWGGRVDTLKLARQQVLVQQPHGVYEYEAVRSYQYTVREMHAQFIKSEYGARQRLKNKGKDLSMKRFRELICPCMTHAKQRDTADEIVAEFKHCLNTWDVCMRKQNQNVKAEIAKCRLTECSQHKEGSETALLYSKASKSPTAFMAYLLCPQIQREELAVKVFEGPSTFAEAMESAKSSNIAEAERRRKIREADFRASAGAKSAPKKLVKEKQEVTLPTRSDEPGFGWYKKACCELRCSDCGIRSRFHKPDTVLANSTPMQDNTCCNCEFECRDDNGEDVDVRVKVKL
jgi:hypothetical protein